MPIFYVCFPKIVDKTCWKEEQLSKKLCYFAAVDDNLLFWAIKEMWQVWLITFDVCKYPRRD